MASDFELKYYGDEPLVPIELDPNIQLQPAENQGGEYAELTAVPLASMYAQYQGDATQQGYMDTAYSQYQYLPYQCPVCYTQIPPAPQYQYPPYQWPVYEDQTAAAYYQPAPQYQYDQCDQYDHVLQERLPDTVGLIQSPADGGVSKETPPDKAAAPQISHKSKNIIKKRQHESQKETKKPYVKKPPNAFMLYMKEQRPLVDDSLTRQGSSMVNKVLAQRWKSLTKREQARYYEEAEEFKMLHVQQHPGWSNRDNYGKMKKRDRRRARITSTDSSDQALFHTGDKLPRMKRLEVRLERLPQRYEALFHTG